jgi:hypothetical protein
VSNNEIVYSHEKGDLVDIGANVGLAGKDPKVIATTDRLVDITGINDIRIRIGTVGGVVKSHKGSSICSWSPFQFHTFQWSDGILS